MTSSIASKSVDHGPDLYTPWREALSSLQARHVGRKEELNAIVSDGVRFIEGGSPLPIYLFGPRGIGKSHILKLAYEQLKEKAAHGVTIAVIPEDIPALRDPEQLLHRIAESNEKPRWQQWNTGDLASLRRNHTQQGRTVLLLEGLDRQLKALGKQGRRNLRQLLDVRGDIWIVGTGVTLLDALTKKDEAFYGAFNPWPLDGLNDEHATALLNHIVGDAVDARSWPARRGAMVVLAGGSARALVALGQACKAQPDLWASEQLHTVVRNFTAHYQMRFRDLSSQAQEMVELFAEAPRQLSPGELAEILQTSPSQMSVQASRLRDDGILRARPAGRKTYYLLAEPLFRFWLEYRTAGWQQTRAGWVTRLLEAILAPEELVEMWLDNPDKLLRQAAGAGIVNTGATAKAWDMLKGRFYKACDDGDEERAYALVGEGLRLNHADWDFSMLALLALVVLQNWADGVPQLIRGAPAACLSYRLLAPLLPYWDPAAAPPMSKRALVEVAEAWAAVSFGVGTLRGRQVGWRFFDTFITHTLNGMSRQRRGRPWKLSAAHRARLAKAPFWRVHFLTRGRLASHPPLLTAGDVVQQLTTERDVIDAPLLLVQALAADHAGLIRAAARKLHCLPRRNPRPTVLLSTGIADMVAFALHASVTPILPILPGSRRRSVSWLGSLALASDGPFDALVETLSKLPRDGASSLDVDAGSISLTALALRHPDRFARVSHALGSDWVDVVKSATAAANLIGSTTDGEAAQPELAHLRGAFFGQPI